MSWDTPGAGENGMKSENEEQTAETNSEKPHETTQSPLGKLRDLRPEKDPMGAGQPSEPR